MYQAGTTYTAVYTANNYSSRSHRQQPVVWVRNAAAAFSHQVGWKREVEPGTRYDILYIRVMYVRALVRVHTADYNQLQ